VLRLAASSTQLTPDEDFCQRVKGSFFSASGSVSAPDAVSAALAGKPWLPPLPAAAWHQITDPCERTRLAAEPVDGPAAFGNLLCPSVLTILLVCR
jgi:hypothetical protein